MTVSTTHNKSGPYNGDGVDQSFEYDFLTYDAAHLKVWLTVDGVDTLQTLGVDYTVTGVGQPLGGTVEMITAPAVGETLTIQRVVPELQETDFSNQGGWFPEVHEKSFDLLTMMAQQRSEAASRHFGAPISDPAGINYEAPPVAERADKFLGFDGSGNLVVYVGVSDPGVAIPVSITNGGTGATTASDARTNLGVPAAADVYTKAETYAKTETYSQAEVDAMFVQHAVGATFDAAAGYQQQTHDYGTTGATLQLLLNATTSNRQKVEVTAAIQIDAPTAGEGAIRLIVKQNSTGGWEPSLSGFANSPAIAWNTAPNAKTLLVIERDDDGDSFVGQGFV